MSSSDELDDIEYTPEPESDDEDNHKNDIVGAKQAIPQQAPTNTDTVIPPLQAQETQLSPSNNTQQPQPKELPPALRARLAKRGILSSPITAPSEQQQQQQQQPSSPSQVKLKRDVSLPPGWFESYDQQYRHKYYYNPTTLERTWLKPFLSLPPGWKAAVDENSGCVYYYNYKTGERHWLPPSSSNNTGVGGGKKAPVNSKEVKPQAKGVGIEKKQSIDPMDPSAYSDAPVGGWNVGQEAAADRGGE
jgi:hypothetical protein